VKPRSHDEGEDLIRHAAERGIAVLATAAPLPEPPVASEGSPAFWAKVSPRGRVRTRDGRVYAFDPERLAARFRSDGVDLPIDFDHGLARQAVLGHRTDAIGWIKHLEARRDGLFARIEWLDAGRQALAARTHRYLSPTFHHDEAGNAAYIHSAALVAAPALPMPALASASAGLSSKEPSAMTLATLAAALGLADNADEAACLAAVEELRSTHEATLARLAAAESLAGLRAEMRQSKVDALIEGALAAKKIMPAEREGYLALCATDAGLETVEELFAKMTPMLTPSGLDARRPKTEPVVAGLGAAARRYMAECQARGEQITYLEAFNRVQEACR